MRTTRTARIVLAALSVLVASGVALAQTSGQPAAQPSTPGPEVAAAQSSAQPAAQPSAPTSGEPRTDITIGGLNLEGYGEAGLRFFPQKPSEAQNAKFMEYQEFSTFGDSIVGIYLDTLRLRLFTPDEKYSFEITGRDWGEKTMQLGLTATRTGLWEAGFDWDQMRQLFSTDARMLATETKDGIFTLPTPRPPLSAYNQVPFADEIGVQWNTAKVFFKLTPTPELDIFGQYTRIRKDGDIPMGMAFGSPGNSFLEVLQPIDQTIHELKLQGTWAKEQWQLQFSYTLSLFENDLTFMRADNPCSSTTAPPAPPGSLAPCSASDLSGPQFGTMSLPPSNMANTFSLSGGVNLPLHTRVNANFSYSRWTQNQDFLPMTSTNSLPASIPALALPENSLHGLVQNVLFNLTATSRPFAAPITFTGKYRYYNLMDESDQPVFSAFLVDDRDTVTQGPERANRFSFMRQGAEVDARWQIMRPLALTTGVGWDQWNRNNSFEVPQTNTLSAKVALDWTPADWALIRGTWVPSYRRGDRYCTNCLAQGEENAEPGELGQSYLLRKYNEADLNQQALTLMVQLNPIDTLTITPNFNYTDQYYLAAGLFHDSAYPGPAEGNVMLGVQQVTSWSAGLDLNWKPTDRISFAGGYVYEQRFEKMRSRNRASNMDLPAADWISNITDTIQTVHFSTLANLIPGRLDLKLNANYSYALGTVFTRTPNANGFNQGGGVGPFPANGMAQRFPAYTDGLLIVGGSLRYYFLKNWTASLNYAYEQWSKSNWQTDTLDPFEPNVSAIWLGNNLKNFNAQIVSLNLGYRFK
jgi:MtrB/PioB family decaheme-associated outer membrane protein